MTQFNYFLTKKMFMNAYKIQYANGDFIITIANDCLEVVKEYDLCNKENVHTRLIQLEGKDKVTALANFNSIN